MNNWHYCTYFDHRYLARGLALHASLQRHAPGSQLWVLCLSEACESALRKLALPGLRAIALAELERFDTELAHCREDRSLIEYYFTCSPCFPRYVLANTDDADGVVYVDSDLYFFADPGRVFEAIGAGSIGITPHRFTPRTQVSHGRFGRFNVGWLSFRRDERGMTCLDWWREQCLAWCHDRVEGDRYADQKYLDQFEKRFGGVCAITHLGANLAPWNVAQYKVAFDGERVQIDGQPLLFYHFQGIREVGPGLYDSNLTSYGARLLGVLREQVYRPYLEELSALERQLVGAGLVPHIEPGIRRQAVGLLALWRAFKARLGSLRAKLLGNIIVLHRRTDIRP